jgi:Ca2+-binding EF-hand superfamily protein
VLGLLGGTVLTALGLNNVISNGLVTISNDQEQALRRCFCLFDSDGDGKFIVLLV